MFSLTLDRHNQGIEANANVHTGLSFVRNLIFILKTVRTGTK